jgi:lipid-A-disaccharide synthase
LKLYIIAGEASGDLHGSNLIKALHTHQRDLEVRCWGGDLMEKAGATLVKHYRDLAFMGFAEVIMNLRTILRNISFCKEDIEAFQPEAIILIDYPGFNMRIAEWAKKKGIRVFYYISPQIWAWKEGRVHKIKRDVEKMFVVLPFEKEFYAKHQYDVNFVGHPLLDVIEKREFQPEVFRQNNGLNEKPIIALLPGSRKQEISVMLPVMLHLRSHYPDHQFVVAGAPGQDISFYRSFEMLGNTTIIFGKTYDLLQYAEAGLVTSGTATLEAGLFQLPQVVCYKGNAISYHIAKRLVKIKYISLVNLILDEEVVLELIQDDMNQNAIKKELDQLLYNESRRQKMKSDYARLHARLGGPGASERTAIAMLKILSSK